MAIVRDHNGQFRKIMKLPSGTDRHDRRTRRQQQGRPVREQFKLKQIRGQFHPQLGTPGAPPTPQFFLARPFLPHIHTALGPKQQRHRGIRTV